ncbi:phenylalanine--tRNA ligase subunit beta [Ammonifex degensii]|uniref:phenylalanine--tRNA ligase subunit beta n=1 Tax=Ammonifex degensii TaxID=42838 RepID=UPI00059DCE29|nr:phenylalanine--tRNA ligase subunit beta [Ammonifex degensii]
MRVPLSWLREFVPVDLDEPQALAERLTAVGVAVDTVEPFGMGIEGVVTARLLEVSPHPNADRLRICQADTGSEVYEVVTGADNVFPGAVVPLALVGARLANGQVIKKARFRGVTSNGMLCSEEELGLEERSAGIMILPPDTPIGEDIRKLLGLPDWVLNLDLTPNRGDCLSIFGVAREVASIYGVELKEPPVLEKGEAGEEEIEVEIEAPELCGRYLARLFKEVKIGPSPLWMQTRLRAAGMRPINNVVDVTNYVMLELGQPLHAFDYTTIRGKRIVVRRARPGEELVLLDGSLLRLGPENLVIADAERAVALAGIMGGRDTEIKDDTTTVLLEAARFDPLNIRRTAKSFGLRTEASLRFERGVDIEGVRRAADRTAYLVEKIGAGRALSLVVDRYVAKRLYRTILVRPEKVEAILGTSFPYREVADKLRRLGFQLEESEEGWRVYVPSFRHDVALEEDMVEEIARVYGYDRIPTTLPEGETTPGKQPAERAFVRRLKSLLTGFGLSEVITYSFINPRDLQRLGVELEALKLRNPLSEEQAVLRTTLLPGLVGVLARNAAHRVKGLSVFEVGRVFLPGSNTLPDERLMLGLAAMGTSPRHWLTPSPIPYDFFYLKGVVEALCRALGIKGVSFVPLDSHPALHPGRAARLEVGGQELGFLGELHPRLQEDYDLPARAVVAELAVAALFAQAKPPAFRPLPRYPGVARDLSFVVRQEIPVAVVEAKIREAAGKLLKELELFDVYVGPHLPPGTRSLAFGLFFQAEDRTLTEEEVNERVEKIVRRLREDLGAELRG